jgi:hypothetical protein
MRLRPRQVWGAGVVVAAVGLLALVALAAEQAPFDVDDDTGGIHVPSWGSVFVLGLVVTLIVFSVILFLSAQRASGGVTRVRRQRGFLNTLATVLVLIALLALLKALRQHHDSETQPIAPPDTEADAKPTPAVSHTGRPWAALMLGGTVLVVLGAAAMTRRRMVDDAGDVDLPTERAEVVASISSSLDALSEPGDDRAAIVAAYAALLDGLARAGRPRRPAEAPEEYVRRILTGWSVRAEPLNELTALFEEARFSEHVLGPEHRARAMSALEAARAEMMAST